MPQQYSHLLHLESLHASRGRGAKKCDTLEFCHNTKVKCIERCEAMKVMHVHAQKRRKSAHTSIFENNPKRVERQTYGAD